MNARNKVIIINFIMFNLLCFCIKPQGHFDMPPEGMKIFDGPLGTHHAPGDKDEKLSSEASTKGQAKGLTTTTETKKEEPPTAAEPEAAKVSAPKSEPSTTEEPKPEAPTEPETAKVSVPKSEPPTTEEPKPETPAEPAVPQIKIPTIPVTAAIPTAKPPVAPPEKRVAAPSSKDEKDKSISKVKEETVKEHKEVGIDTIDIESGGNWLKKRVWWENGVEAYEKAKEWLKKVLDTRVSFYLKRNNLDSDLDAFYLKIGFDRGGCELLLQSLEKAMEKIRQEQGALDLSERGLIQSLADNKALLDGLKGDIENLKKIDKSVDSALDTLLSHVDRCRFYENEAWENLKKIGIVLLDGKAKELYYHIESDVKNIQQLYDYITQKFADYFNKNIQQAHDTQTKIQAKLKSLQDKGIDLQKQIEKVQEDETRALEKKIEEDAVEKTKKEMALKEKEQAKPISFIQKTKALANQLYETSKGFVSGIYDRITHLFARKKPISKTIPAAVSEEKKRSAVVSGPQKGKMGVQHK